MLSERWKYMTRDKYGWHMWEQRPWYVSDSVGWWCEGPMALRVRHHNRWFCMPGRNGKPYCYCIWERVGSRWVHADGSYEEIVDSEKG